MNKAILTQVVRITLVGRTEIVSREEAEALRDDLTNILYEDGTTIAASAIIKAVGDECNVSVEKMKSKLRTYDIVDARHVSWYLLRRLTQLTFKEIARMFGKKDHATIMLGCRKIEAQRDSRPRLKEHLERPERTLNATVENPHG